MRAFALASLVLLSGCFNAPKTYNFAKSEAYLENKDIVWGRLVGLLTSQNVQIKTIDKESGVIYAEPSIGDGDVRSYADCGSGDSSPYFQHVVGINFFVRALSANQTLVTVNASISEVRDPWGGAPQMYACNSNGTLENKILIALR